MVWLIGHRQPKGAATAMLEPTATAPHLDSTLTFASPLRGLSPAGELKRWASENEMPKTVPLASSAFALTACAVVGRRGGPAMQSSAKSGGARTATESRSASALSAPPGTNVGQSHSAAANRKVGLISTVRGAWRRRTRCAASYCRPHANNCAEAQPFAPPDVRQPAAPSVARR